jgi:hypothetical protein
MSRACLSACPLQPAETHAKHPVGWCCGVWNGKRQHHCAAPAGRGTGHKGSGRCRHHLGKTEQHIVAGQRALALAECERLGIPLQIGLEEGLLDLIYTTAGSVAVYEMLVQSLALDMTQVVAGRLVEGIANRTLHQSGIPTGEAKPHIYVLLWNAERDRLARYIELAVRLNIEDRQVRITERDAALLLRAQVGALRTMGLDDDQIDEFRARFARILREGE